ncbi:hypothetical protein JCGZ_14743 [Jatropha curcas]|uniref:Bulb-type lectin domain-containing protein n=1 Tax=Jatropha curcas TaxID=180498 RepID=A0A067KJU6_JATCU|nr:hypothetical protein JCGZ_14743 [Jatropha curcas]
MGTARSESLRRWVWEANRGNPVGENATLNFGTDGNLVLTDADGRIAWQTNTANKGVIGFKIFPNGPLQNLTLLLGLQLAYQGPPKSFTGGTLSLTRPTYNTTLSYLRLEIDGNLRIHTYDDDADWNAWQVTYTLFSKNSYETECQLPERCGKFGLCEEDQCVACPSPKGLLGWSKNRQPAKVNSCGLKDFYYYKLEGIDHFTAKYTTGDGPMKQDACSSKFSKDCKCSGYFYHTQSSKCWIAYDIKTLTKGDDSTHLAFVKAPNK